MTASGTSSPRRTRATGIGSSSAGMEFDSLTGEDYDRARSYDSIVGRFVTQDPAGFATESVQLYAFVFNSPIDLVDRTGMSAQDGNQEEVGTGGPAPDPKPRPRPVEDKSKSGHGVAGQQMNSPPVGSNYPNTQPREPQRGAQSPMDVYRQKLERMTPQQKLNEYRAAREKTRNLGDAFYTASREAALQVLYDQRDYVLSIDKTDTRYAIERARYNRWLHQFNYGTPKQPPKPID